MDAMDAINVLMYFVVVTLLFQLLAKHSSAALPCKRLLTSVRKHVNDLSATLHHTQMVSFAIIKLFLLFNTRATVSPFSRPILIYINSYNS